MTETNKRLIPFLRNLADSIENGDILPNELKRIGEFFMSYQFQKQADKDLIKDSDSETTDFSREDVVKFLVLGWYIYQVLLVSDTLPERVSEEEDID